MSGKTESAVLVLAGGGDPQAGRTAACLHDYGVPVISIDTGGFPDRVRIAHDRDGYQIDGHALPPIRSVYVRGLGWHPLSPVFSGALRDRPTGFLAQCEEKRALLESLILDLASSGARIVNSIAANALHGVKPHQMTVLHRAGLPVPAWVATNDPDAVRAFVAAHDDVVYKPLSGGARVQLLGPEDLEGERLASLALAPVLFQRCVRGTAVRAFVADGLVIGAAAIHSEALDYRGQEERIEAVDLSDGELQIVLGAAAACGMVFTGVDLIRSGRESWLLECNPSPMFALLEARSGLDVAGPLARLLARGAVLDKQTANG